MKSIQTFTNNQFGSLTNGSNNILTGNTGTMGSITVSSGTSTAYSGTSISSGVASGYYNTISSNVSSSYDVLGEVITIDEFPNDIISQNLSLINILGWKYYDELKKNNFNFPDKISKLLERKIKVLKREEKINDIVK